ncbi:SRPBCC family protein [Sphingosinicella sp. CPCC 101087]|uniref:SRPBCC family protein n=1 Tax=Sphingosinicella sp. CPCC 101087 TaxID=2497754 RepID=UPI00101DA858|nr:SRPBCC family protein [Sphingosinicella sp. CPCC 101087]
MTGKVSITASGERELVITRLFEAPPHLVFEAHTVPALMKRWFTGPEGWTLATCEIDLRPGGTYRHEWAHEDGRKMGMSGTFQEIDPPHRLVATELFDEDWTGGGTVNTQTFEPVGDGRTRLTTTVLCTSAEARDSMLQSNMEAGIAASYARLDAVLADVPIGKVA